MIITAKVIFVTVHILVLNDDAKKVGINMLEFSETFDRWYESHDHVFIRNVKQAARYIEWGAKLVDLFVDGQHKLVLVFPKEDHERLRDRWGTKENNHIDD